MNRNKKLNIYIKIGLLSAIAVVLMFFSFPIVPIALWLKIDFSDVPALIGGFAFGPLAGVAIELLKNILGMLVGASSAGIVGALANFLIGVAFVLPASFIYSKNKTKKGAIIGMLVGIVSITIVGVLANIYILLPLYGMSMIGKELRQYVVAGVIPMNLIKGTLISVITFVLYKKLVTSILKNK